MATDVELATAWIRLVPSFGDARAKITKEIAGVDLDKPAEEAGKKYGDKFSAGMKTTLLIGAGTAVAGLVGVFNTGIEELKFGEQVSAQTDQLIKNTGAAFSTSEIEDYTLALSKVSGVSEEDLQAAGNKLLEFGITNEDIYKQAVDGINNIASKTGDVGSASAAMAKALQDPASAAGVLRKAGIALTEEQQSMIEKMIEAGDVAGAQQVILDQVEATYGGMAETMGATAEGSLARMNNAWENLAGTAVEFLMPAITSITDGLAVMFGWLQENTWVFPIIGAGILAIAAAILIWSFATGALTTAQIAANLAFLASPITWIIIGIVALVAALILLIANWDAVVKWVTDVWNGFLTWFGEVMAGFNTWWDETWAGIAKGWEDFWAGVGQVAKDIWNNILGWIEGGVNGAIDLINGMIGGINNVTGVVGIKFGKIPHVELPRLADGATILPRRGGTAAILAEAGRPETVVDTGLINRALEEGLVGSRAGGGRPVEVNVYPAPGMDEATVGRIAAGRLGWTLREA